MSKAKLFLENFLVYGIGGIISKIIPFLMLPIVTRLMPNTEYFGINDLSNTVISFGSAFAVLGMYDALCRMFFEKKDREYKRRVCSTALVFTFYTSMAVFTIIILLGSVISKFLFRNREYAYIIYLSALTTLVGATNQIISAPTRMQNKRKEYVTIHMISPILSYSLSIPMLIYGYYALALPLAAFVSCFAIELTFGVMNKEWFNFKLFDKKLLKQMLLIAFPLFPNFIMYWIFNSCDKVMITNMLGVAAAGIYSLGSRLGHASQLIYTAFAGGWQFFSFSTMKEANQVVYNSKIYEYLGIISFIITSFVCALSYGIFKTLFRAEYLRGYIIAPYLFLAPLCQMLFQIACNQFIIIKKTWPIICFLSFGAICNIFINYILIPKVGIEGAAVSTLIGYFISNILCVIVLVKIDLMKLSFKFILACFIMFLFTLVWRFFLSSYTTLGTILAMITSIIFCWMYKDDLSIMVKGITKRKGTQNRGNDQ